MALFISSWEWNRETVPKLYTSRPGCFQRAKHPRGLRFVGMYSPPTDHWMISSISLCHQLEFPTLRPFLGGAVTVTLFHHSAEPCHPWHAHETGISVLACFNPAKLSALWRCFAWESQRILKKLGVKVDHETRGANVRWCFGSTNRVRFRMNSESYTTSAHNYPQDTARTCLHKVHFAHLIWVCLEIRDWEPRNLLEVVEFCQRGVPNFETYPIYPVLCSFYFSMEVFQSQVTNKFGWHQIIIHPSFSTLQATPSGRWNSTDKMKICPRRFS